SIAAGSGACFDDGEFEASVLFDDVFGPIVHVSGIDPVGNNLMSQLDRSQPRVIVVDEGDACVGHVGVEAEFVGKYAFFAASIPGDMVQSDICDDEGIRAEDLSPTLNQSRRSRTCLLYIDFGLVGELLNIPADLDDPVLILRAVERGTRR